MTDRDRKRRSFFLLATVAVLTALILSVVVMSARKQERNLRQQPKDWLVSVPTVESKVKDLEIINAKLVRLGDLAGVAFEVKNNSDRAVMAVRISCGENGISQDGLANEDKPIVIIEPHGTLKAVMYDELTRDAPMVISSATFADGTEIGTESSVKLMQKMRAHERAKNKIQREGQPTERKPNQ